MHPKILFNIYEPLLFCIVVRESTKIIRERHTHCSCYIMSKIKLDFLKKKTTQKTSKCNWEKKIEWELSEILRETRKN